MYRSALLLLLPCLPAAAAISDPRLLLKEAVEAQQSGNLDKAIADYRTLLAAYPSIAEIHSNLGAAYAAEGKYTEAITEYDASLKLKPNPQARMNLALAHYKLGEITPAVAELLKVRKEEASNMQVVTLLGDCYLRLGRNKDIIALLAPIQKANPDNHAFDYMLGMALLRDGQVAEGQRIIDPILRNGESAEASLLLGTSKYITSDFSGARDEFAKAVKLNPNLPDVYAYYGLALLATGDQDNAKIAFLNALKADPNDFESNLHMGVLLRHDENNDQALKYLRHSLDIRPGDPGARYQIATIELERSDLNAACRDLESLIKDNPNFIEAHVSLATVYFREKRKEDGDREREIYAKLNAQRNAKNEIAAAPGTAQ